MKKFGENIKTSEERRMSGVIIIEDKQSGKKHTREIDELAGEAAEIEQARREYVKAENIRASLLEQLKARGADITAFVATINSYIFYWREERKMQNSVIREGTRIKTKSANGTEYYISNPAVKDAVLYNKQQLAILKELGLNCDSIIKPDEDDLFS